MTKTIFNTISFLLLLYHCTFAQITISGIVKETNGNALEYVNVFLQGTADGGTTDGLGRFSFITSEAGQTTIVASYIGYKTFEESVTLAGADIVMNIFLTPDTKHLGEVVISAGTFEASDKSRGASLTPIDAVTVAGTGADLANALRALPGTQQIGEQAGLFVRGGTNEEAKQFIDGLVMKNPNFSNVPGILQPARISPFLFKGIIFSSGGYSALFGQAMSSALILESVDFPEKSSASFSVFPPHQGAGFQQLSADKKISYGINAGYSNYDLFYNAIVPQKPDYFHGPEYLSTDANFRIKTGKSGILKFYTNAGYNNIGMRNPDIDSLELKSSFQNTGKSIYTTLSYAAFLNDNWQMNLGTAYSYDNVGLKYQLLNADNELVAINEHPFIDGKHRFRNQSDFSQGRIVLTRFFQDNHVLRIGAENFLARDHYSSNDTLHTLEDDLAAVFVEGDIYLTDNFAAKIGARFEHSSFLNSSSLAPRLSVAYRFNKGGQVSVAYGVFFQKPENQYLLQSKMLQFTKATHYIVNYQKSSGNRMFRAEVYYKLYDKLIKTVPSIANSGDGYARGVELFFRDKKTIKDLDYWISYTYLDTKREFQNYPSSLSPSFATPHTFSIATKKFFPNLNLSVNAAYFFSTGRPYYDIRFDDAGETKIFDSGKTKNYSALNLHVAYLLSFFKKWKQPDFSGIALGVNNLLGAHQVFGYNYSQDGTNKVPVTLPATRTYYIGVFFNFGIDRRDEMMDQNL
jgi:outer membrane receptor for ferrienterochelin and colicin